MEQPFVNLGSLTVPEAPPVAGPLALRWRQPLARHRLGFFAVAADAIAVSACREEREGEWYSDVDRLCAVLDPETGAVRFQLAERVPVGRLGGALVTAAAGGLGRDLQAHDLQSGALRWRRQLGGGPAGGLRAVPGALLAWDPDVAGSLRLHAAPDEEAGPGGAGALPGLRLGKVAQVRGARGLLAVRLWDGGQAAVFRLGEGPPELLWQRRWEGYADIEVLVDDGGWVCRSPESLEAFSPRGEPLWRVAGAKRLILGPRFAVGVRGPGDALFAVERSRGAEIALPGPAPWDLTLAGDDAWIVDRRAGTLRCLDLRTGAVLSEQRQAVPGYGLSRAGAALGYLYGASDEGDVYCLGPARS